MTASEWIMLPTVWAIGDPRSPGYVADAEALCRGVIRELLGARTPKGRRDTDTRRTAGGRMQLEQVEYDDSLAFLLAKTVELEREFDDTRTGILFRPWLYQRLRWALIDEWRSPRMFGRHGQHRVPRADDQAADGRDAGDTGEEVGGDAASDLRTRRLQGVAAGDPADRTDVDRWVHADGDRGEAEYAGEAAVGGLCRVEGAGAQGGVDRAGAGAGGSAGRPDARPLAVAPLEAAA